MCVKRMLYCPGSGQELLTAFGVTMERFSYFEITFVNYGGVVEFNGLVMGPCMVRNSGGLLECS